MKIPKARPWLVCLSSSSLLLPVAAQQILTTVPGQSGERFGAAAIEVPDQNGDGVADLLIGSPGSLLGQGGVTCLSGDSLGTGSPVVLWTIQAGFTSLGAGFGCSLAVLGDWNGDGQPEFVVGAPNYRPPASGITTGAIYMIDGATHTVLNFINGFSNTRLGTSLAALGDQDGDGRPDLAAFAPSTVSGGYSTIYGLPASSFGGVPGLSLLPHWAVSFGSYNDFGASLASFDLDGDGRQELVAGLPGQFAAGAEAGGVWLLRGNDFVPLSSYSAAIPGERLGQSVDVRSDYDGDGVADLVVGAPNWSAGVNTEDGRVVVLSGAALLAQAPPFLREFKLAVGVAPATFHFGASVRASRDLNGDGVGEIVVGAPDYHTVIPSGPSRGAVTIYSGATGFRMAGLVGSNRDRLGDTLVGAFADLDGDGLPEFAAAGSTSDNPTVDCGTLKVARLFPAPPGSYCTAKSNSLGCAPSMSWSGTASASSTSPFLVTCASVLNNKNGLLFYSHEPAAKPFQGGFLCTAAPRRRTPVQDSGGSSSGADCSGTLAFDFNTRIQSGADPTLTVGREVFSQYWSRDPASPGKTSLSNGLRFLVNP